MYKNRRDKVQEILNSKPFTTFRELEKMFPDVSSMTIRRDIDYFQAKGEAVKVRGGARSVKYMVTTMDDCFDRRVFENAETKSIIAEAALKYVVSGKRLFFDSGSTCVTLSKKIGDGRLNITTNCPAVMLELMKKPNTVVNIVGGTVNRADVAISGVEANKYIDGVNIDVAFLVPTGYDEINGFTGGNWAENDLKRHIVKKAEKIIVLLDSSKFGKVMEYSFGNIEDISMIITDKPLPEAVMTRAKAKGVEIIIAK